MEPWEERGYERAIAENMLRPQMADEATAGRFAPRFLATRIVANSALPNVALGTF